MKIAFDHQIFMLQPYGGISRYFVRLADELIALNEDVRVVAPLYCNQYLDSLPKDNIVGRRLKRFPHKAARLTAPLNCYFGKREINRFAPAVLHETYYAQHPIQSSIPARILTVYDMIHERFSDTFPARDRTSLYKRSAIKRADHIISISHSTKRDLCEIYDVPSEKVSVVHLGFEKFLELPGHTQDCIADRPFLLFVGNRSGYKNFEGMLRAIASRRELLDTFDIVAFGSSRFTAAEMLLIQTLGLREGSVRQLSGDDRILGELYRAATAFVYPSLYEGFGLPPLEAMAHSCPVITSNTSSLPEVVGRAGQYFSPSDIDEQAQAICDVVFKSDRRDDLVQLGKERLRNFSWKRCAQETREVYREFI